MWGHTEKMASNMWTKKQASEDIKAASRLFDLGFLASNPGDTVIKCKTPRPQRFSLKWSDQIPLSPSSNSIVWLPRSRSDFWLRGESFALNFLSSTSPALLSEQKAKKSLSLGFHLRRPKRGDYRFCLAVVLTRNPKYKRTILKKMDYVSFVK